MRCTTLQQCPAAIIPLGRDSHHGSSSLPEGCSLRKLAPSRRESANSRLHFQRAGPALPSYLALHHAGFSVLPVLLPGRWALTPPFHPCQTEPRFEGILQVSLLHATALRSAGGLFSVALSVAEPHRAGFNPAPRAEARNSAFRQSLHGWPPDVIRRVAPYPETAAKRSKGLRHRLSRAYDDGVRTFLPPRLCSGGFTPPFLDLSQRSPGSPANSIIAAEARVWRTVLRHSSRMVLTSERPNYVLSLYHRPCKILSSHSRLPRIRPCMFEKQKTS